MLIDYTTLEVIVPHLTLEESFGGFFSAVDQHGRLYVPPSRDMNVAIRQMRAMAIRGDATLDEGSITWFRALRAEGEFSVRAGSLSEREQTVAAPTGGDYGTRPSRSESDLASLGGDPTGGAGMRAAPVPRAVAVNDEPASPPSEIGATGAAAAGRTGAPMHLRLVN